MGLDMYLYRKCYVQNWTHTKPQDRHEITVLKGGAPRADIKPERICYVVEQVAYWRKANAVHRWFVENCQNGIDDCRESPVTTKQLCGLVASCKHVLETVETVEGVLDAGTAWHPDGRVEHHTIPGKVIAQPELAANMLPTKSGFFFGSTDYDENYLQYLRDTIAQLEPLLDDTDGDYYYRALW